MNCVRYQIYWNPMDAPLLHLFNFIHDLCIYDDKKIFLHIVSFISSFRLVVIFFLRLNLSIFCVSRGCFGKLYLTWSWFNNWLSILLCMWSWGINNLLDEEFSCCPNLFTVRFSQRKWFCRIKMLKNHLLVPWTLYLMVRKEDFLLFFQYGYSVFSVMIIGNCCYEMFFLESCLVIICMMTIINNQSSFLSPKYAY